MSTETEADAGKVSYEYRTGADLTETEVDDGNDSSGDDALPDLEADDREDSFGDFELADIEETFGSRVKNNPTLSSMTSLARPDLEHETLSHHWIEKSKEASGSRNFLAKEMWQPFFLIITESKWMEYIFYTVLAIVIQVTFGRSSFFPDGHSDGKPTCDAFNGMAVRNATMCDFMFVLERGHSQLQVLVAFILSGFVASTVNLWRKRRTAYLALCGACRNLIIQIASLLPISEDKQTVNVRKKMERWAVLGFELAVLNGRGLMDTEEGRHLLESLGLVVDNEWDAMVPGDRHTTVWFWMQLKATQLADEGKISELRLQTICNAVTLIRDKANNIMSGLNWDEPPPYVSVIGTLVNFNLMIFSVGKGVEWAVWYNDTGGRVWLCPKMYFEVLLLLSYNALFSMLFDLSLTLYNPFGPRCIDLPHNIVGGGIRRLAKRLATGEDVPRNMDTDHGPGHSFETTSDEGLAIPEHDDIRQRRRSLFRHGFLSHLSQTRSSGRR